MTANPLPPADALRRTFRYTPETGVLVRRSNGRPCASNNGKGYIQVSVAGRAYYAHRVIWVMMTGEPLACDIEIDHKNRVRDDNRWTNLRRATITQQRGNSTLPPNRRELYT